LAGGQATVISRREGFSVVACFSLLLSVDCLAILSARSLSLACLIPARIALPTPWMPTKPGKAVGGSSHAPPSISSDLR
jgi:hypothetical protein